MIGNICLVGSVIASCPLSLPEDPGTLGQYDFEETDAVDLALPTDPEFQPGGVLTRAVRGHFLDPMQPCVVM